mgnify:CR=1 FL=1
MLDQRVIAQLDELTKGFTKDDVELLKAILRKNKGQEFDVLQDLLGYTYRHRPVGVRRFIEEPEFMGLKGQIYPKLLDDLEELFEGDYVEAVLTGAIGWGKSTFAEIAMARMIYEVSCFRNPQKAYGLMDGTIIAFINVSVNRDNARKVVFQGLKTKLLNSMYFREVFPPEDKFVSELRFPGNVWVFPVASNETSILGYNVYGGVMDEVNFMSFVEKSARTQGKFDQAETLYNTLIRRMKSRFMKQGKLPGILVQVSSSKYPDDFTERRLKDAESDTQIFTRRYSQWDTLPQDKYSGEKFLVSLGSLTRRPEILKTEENVVAAKEEDFQIVEVPIEYEMDFERDIDMAIRDLIGMPTLTIKPFIPYRWKLYEAMEKGPEMLGLEHPYTAEVTTLQDGATFDVDKLLVTRAKKAWEQEKDPAEKFRLEQEYKKERAKPRFIHVDLATSSMAGFAMGHVRDYAIVERRNEEGQLFSVKVPIIVVEMMLRIQAPKGGEIEISDVRQLVYELRSYNYRIGKVSFDQFQSKESRQQLKRSGIESDYLTADANPGVYLALKNAIYEDRLITYHYDPAYQEMIRLEKSEKTGKVDHPPGGSKDVSDAVAGVCYLCEDVAPVTPGPPPSLGVVYAPQNPETNLNKELGIPIVK